MGWNRIVKDSLESYLGIKQGATSNDSVGFAAYCRRSSKGTKDRTALEAQEQEILSFCQSEFGVSPDSVRVFKEQTSGISFNFKTRKELAKLWGAITRHEISTLVIKDKSRLCRIDAHNAFEQHCKDCGVRLIYVHTWNNDDQDEMQEEMGLLLDYLQIFTAKRTARKSAFKSKILIEGETRETILRLKRQGLSLTAIIAYLDKHGIKGQKNDGSPARIARSTLNNYFLRIKDIPLDNTNPLERYIKERLTKGKNKEVLFADLYQDYSQWCGANKIETTSAKTLSMFLTARGGKKGRSPIGEKTIVGFALKVGGLPIDTEPQTKS